MTAAVERVIFYSMMLMALLKTVHNYQVAQMNARLLPTFTNAAVTLLQVSPPIFSPAQKATPPL
jgi:hypothetical protein